ncbi:hypothetical protein ZIOFF_034476 [Zingiber officinale]|uniref:Neprosin PEP catalytic domain-containing protein n=1 Tax=Zingiber officinale TaxID=94328 RepID=A0A8J5GSC8_ZINOF|nr:hypothetical protein ZIOFF_034476 [Zingiber officinale]
MEVKEDDDIRALVDSSVIIESTSYPQLYVKTRKYRIKGRRSVCTQEAELGGRRSFCDRSLGLLHETVMQSGRHSVYASTSELIGDPFILPSRHSVCAPSFQPFGDSTLQCDRRSVYVSNQALSEAPFEPSLGASIYDEAGPSHEVMEYFRVLSHSDVPLPESIDIPITTNDCQSNPSEEEDSDGLLGQDECEEEAMIEVPEAFQFTVGANYPVSADWIGSVGNTVGMVVGTKFDTTLEFQEKEDVINAVKQYSLNCSREYEVAESSSRVWSVVCRNTKYECSWQLRAARLKKVGGGWGITRYKGKHRRLNRRLLSEFGVIGMNHTNIYHISSALQQTNPGSVLKPSNFPKGMKLAKSKPASFYGFNDTCPSGTVLIQRARKQDLIDSQLLRNQFRAQAITHNPTADGSHNTTVEGSHDSKTGNWWVTYNDQLPLGYFPKELLPNMNKYASALQMGGHVYSPLNVPSPPMGSGHPSTEGPNKAAYFIQVQSVDSSNNLIIFDDEYLEFRFDISDYYSTADDHYTYNADKYVFAYGGPGGFTK